MWTKHQQKWRVILVMLVLLTGVYLSGCQPTKQTQEGVPGLETTVPSPSPTPELGSERKETPRPPEIPQASTSGQKEKVDPKLSTETSPLVPVDESDNNPAPTPPPALPQTPIHPYYDLGGAPPSAPGLAMRVRVFNVEPPKIAYLTFDDGPYPGTTPRILKILQDEGVKATFFVLGGQVERYPDLLKAEFEQGQGIGNHSYSHDYRSLYRSPEAFLAEIKQTEELIFRTIGTRPQIVRAPGGTQGHFHVNYYNALDAADYLIYDWNVSSGDTAAPLVPANQLIHNIETQVPGKSRIIILMHDAGAKVTTVDALPQIIEYLKQQGYTFGVLTPKVAPILFPGGFHS
ncbi:polysaccharide deacetylase family protein [Desulfosporosinus sp. Sb-LF]|uniref:polysaccharide deacetylase family protein n=1 Tax=Desulfosporosinus sp. Sb-LF TaxID=2560027 RepID=UPI00107F2BE0|nr:polysaccharide deacetylase family protein [Desulfosporosinus sp. Sb-LF]TGE33899.1 polysaccharide deacetylase [Desulfosporosinus sp. Sb-LF]